LGRTGGEEFLLLLPEVRLDDAVRIIERIRDGFPAAVLEHSGVELPSTFSAGVTEALPDDDRSSILRRGDRALYAAKEEGRNRTKISFKVTR
jgi:diguanylate cyclase (GGDEF)-like protein